MSQEFIQINDGVTSSGLTINDGDDLQIAFGGVVSNTVIDGSPYLYSGMTYSGAEMNDFGSAISTSIINGGSATVHGGGSADVILIGSGGILILSDGAAASVTDVQAGGAEIVFGGATVSGADIEPGSILVVLPGADITGVSGAGTVISTGDVVLYGGGSGLTDEGATPFGLTVSSGAMELVLSGAAPTGDVIAFGGSEDVFGTATSASVSGFQTVSNGGVAVSTTIEDYGDINVLSGGTALGAIVDAGTEFVYAGLASGTRLEGGDAYDFVLGGVASGTIIGGGTQEVEAGGSAVGAVLSRGAQDVNGLAEGTTVNSGGQQYVYGGGIAEDTTVANGGVLWMTSGSIVRGAALEVGGTIDASNFAYAASGSASLNSSTDLLTVTEGGSTYTLQLGGDYTNEAFDLTRDDGDGTDITAYDPPCYCPGTLILTPEGEVPIENLEIGGVVTTLSGENRRVKWVGRRSYGGRFALGRADILPIRVAAGALDEAVPRRDLWISPHHALYLDGVLIEAADLVNGISIVQAESVESVTYIHIELDTHDILLAEGAPAESFIDDDTRFIFHNAHEYAALYPGEVRETARYCAPRLKDGYAVEAVRRRIDARAGISARQEAAIELSGSVDVSEDGRVAGWARNTQHPEAPVCLDVVVNGIVVGQTLANRQHSNLPSAGYGSGQHGFLFLLPPDVTASRDIVEVRRSLDGVRLADLSPVRAA